MIIEKTRGKIQCYWETKVSGSERINAIRTGSIRGPFILFGLLYFQPSGCCKPHCVFKHTKRQNINNNDDEMTSSAGPDAVPNNVEPTTAAAAGMDAD